MSGTSHQKDQALGNLLHWSGLNGVMIFLEIAEYGSIGRAAAALSLTQPALSRALHQFEARLGGQVVIRTPKGVRLTPLGDSLLVEARAIRDRMRNIREHAVAQNAVQAKKLSCGIVKIHPLIPFSRAVLDLQRHIPDVRIEMIFGTSTEILELLREEKIDVAMAALIDDAEAGGLLQEVCYYSRRAIYCRPEHPLKARANLSIQDLVQADWIAPRAGTFSRDRVAELFESQGIPSPPFRLSLDEISMRRALVMQSDFLSIFQIHHVQGDVEAGTLVRLPYDWPQKPQAIGAIRRHPYSSTASLFIKLIKAQYDAVGLAAESEQLQSW